ncbi:hypothetical protein LCGC14_0614500 [marine sediment metagenome]|uniref:CpXC domain-containing protein n=1 Tax=marine sediment metagenome TaxID=412755 RepID=A0A0F9R6P3_9ZZZZ
MGEEKTEKVICMLCVHEWPTNEIDVRSISRDVCTGREILTFKCPNCHRIKQSLTWEG